MQRSNRFRQAFKWVTRTLGLAAVLAAEAATAQSAKFAFSEEQIPAFNIPKMAAAPKIDGVIDPAEWQTAMEIRGMSWAGGCGFINRPHAFWVAWDEGHLYLAGRAHVLKGHVLGKSRREKYTTGTVFDDAYRPQASDLPDVEAGKIMGRKMGRQKNGEILFK